MEIEANSFAEINLILTVKFGDDLLSRIFPYLVRMQENLNQKKLRI